MFYMLSLIEPWISARPVIGKAESKLKLAFDDAVVRALSRVWQAGFGGFFGDGGL
jgi:hypothetical protein